MNRLVQIANAKLDAEEKALLLEQSVMAQEQVAMSNSLHVELLTKFQSILTPTIREELKLGVPFRTDDAPAVHGNFDGELKQEFAPGSVVVFGESEYPRAADGKIYVFLVAIILTKAFGKYEIHFWLTNSYTGRRQEKLEEAELEAQIGLILLERADVVERQFVKEDDGGNLIITLSTIAAWVAFTTLIVGIGMMCYAVSSREVSEYYLENGRTIAKFGFFANLATLPFAMMGGWFKSQQKRGESC